MGSALFLTLLASAAAHAEPTSADIEHAKQLFKEAVALRAEDKLADAITKIEQALAIKETAGLRYHLATYQRDSGLLVEALANYRRARDLAAAAKKHDDVSDLVGPALKELEPRIPTLELAGDPSRSVSAIEIDGKGGYETPIQLNPGNHELLVRASDGTPFTQSLSVKEGDRLRVEVKWPAAAAPAAPAPVPTVAQAPASAQPAAADEASRSLVPVYIGASVAAAALGGGIYFTLAASSSKDDARRIAGQIPGDSACAAPPKHPRCGELSEAWDSYDRNRNLSYAAYSVAGAAALGTAVYLLWPSSKPSSQSGWRARPFVAKSPDHWALYAVGSF